MGCVVAAVRHRFCLLTKPVVWNIRLVKIHKTSIAVAAMLAAAHAVVILPVSLASTPQTTEVKEQQETVDLNISGMTWPVNCPKRVRSALEKVSGVVSAEVTHPDKAVVQIKKGKTDADKLIAAVKKAGYGASLKREKK
jgi:Cu+-exporting ATPase